MKVAIVTQPLGLNVGGMLQNLALQQALRSLGHESVTIRYQIAGPGLKDLARIAARNVRTLLRRLSGRADRMLYLCDLRPSRANLRFISRHIACTPGCGSYAPVEDAGAYVVGSDQVWRPRYNVGTLPDMFLRFAAGQKVRRVAYAASFGVGTREYDEALIALCSPLLAAFDAVSVRERSGVELCRDMLGRADAAFVADPTMLLTADDYRRICADIPVSGSRRVVSYILDLNTDKRTACRTFARTLGAPLRDLAPRATAPDRWLAAIRDAAFVVTDSFHGTVFAIIMGKPFAVLANDKRGNSRLLSLLDSVGLADRVVTSPADIDRIAAAPVDYAAVADIVARMRHESFDFLKKSLNSHE